MAPRPRPAPAPSPVAPASPAPPLQQHDLHPNAVRQLIERARPRRGDVVVEVGPGMGAITRALLASGAQVLAAELDPTRTRALAQSCAEAIASGQLQVIHADARTWTPLTDGRPWRVVANPPFQHSAELMQRWMLAEHPPSAIDLVLQRETAHKLCHDRERGHSRSSALIACAGEARFTGGIPREATTPPSRVDLALWSFRRVDWAATPAEMQAIDRILAQAFAGAHTMRLALRGVLTPEQVRRQAGQFRWDLDAHPRTLPAKAWLGMARFLAGT